ncbi:uncharacterized protein LOC120137610 [Hibiscus syriacus]|uniref:uncharacterized protein LOC120137610 n=1 Tax=Hibiscus syriacus TaxID=106335 RepID=UPI001924E83E|nr:uncharacterized protein LOC120137610 [Hibiscus syriacus]
MSENRLESFDTMFPEAIRYFSQLVGTFDPSAVFRKWVQACLTASRFSISFNASLVGFSKGARVLDKGILFPLALCVFHERFFSKMLDVDVVNEIFKFQPKCKRVGLTHLCFADDLLTFYKGTLGSIVGVLSVLDCFYSYFGLRLNATKSEVFISGASVDQLEGQVKGVGVQASQLCWQSST